MTIRTNISIDTMDAPKVIKTSVDTVDAPNTGVVAVAAAEAGCAGEDTMASGGSV